MNRSIIHTRPGDDSYHLFESLPATLYPAHSIRIKQHDGINKEFLHSCYVLVEDQRPVARLALYFNPFLRYNEKAAACIGNYECIEDAAAGKELISFAEDVARKNAYSHIIGPMNGSTWDNYRFSAHNDHPNFFLEPYHHSYYNTHFTNAGYGEAASYLSLIDRKMDHVFPGVLKREEELTAQGVTFRNIDTEDYSSELDRIHAFCMDAFKNNFLFTPLSAEAFRSKYLPLQSRITPGHAIIAEHQGSIVGLVFTIDDLYSAERVLILKTLARNMSKAYSGLGNVLGYKMTRYAKDNDYTAVIHAFIIDMNVSHELSKQYSSEPYKHYLLYSKEL